jgi:hypothetical protein
VHGGGSGTYLWDTGRRQIWVEWRKSFYMSFWDWEKTSLTTDVVSVCVCVWECSSHAANRSHCRARAISVSRVRANNACSDEVFRNN